MNLDQQQAFDYILQGNSIFISGDAGTGKSFIIKKIRDLPKCAITATTGIAAFNIGGITIDSWAGYRPDTKYTPNYKNIKKTKILVIDEFSMMDMIKFNIINKECQRIKNSIKPFGGIQVIGLGDFKQLPPVNPDWKLHIVDHPLFIELFSIQVIFTQNMRQKEDLEFRDLLDALRNRNIQYKHKLLLRSRMVPAPPNTPKIFSLNKQVTEFCNLQMKDVTGIKKYPIKYWKNHEIINYTEEKYTSEEFAVGIPVILTKNLDVEKGLANGTLGIVLECNNNTELLVQFHDDAHVISYISEFITTPNNEKICKEYVPLKLAYAFTTFKTQSLTLDRVCVNMKKPVINYVEFYVAVSRVRRLQDLYIEAMPSVI